VITNDDEFRVIAKRVCFAALPNLIELGWTFTRNKARAEDELITALASFPDGEVVTAAQSFQSLHIPMPSEIRADFEELRPHLDVSCIPRLDDALAAIPVSA